MKKATQKTIAEKVNVSRATVSRALFDNGYVEKSLKEKILKTAEELGYHSNAAARSLATHRDWNIYCFLVSYDTSFASKIEEGLRAAVSEFSSWNININIEKHKPDNPWEQVKRIEYILKNEKVDGLILSPMLHDEINGVLKKSNKNFALASLNLLLNNENSLFFVGSNDYLSGKISANTLTKLICPKEDILFFNAYSKFESLNNRSNGFIDEIKDYTEINLIEYPAKDSKEEYYNLFKKINLKNIKGIYSNTKLDGIAYAINKLSRKDIILIGNDFNKAIEKNIKNKIIDAVIFQRPHFQGYIAGKLLFDFLFSKVVPDKKETYVGFDIITETNIDVEQLFHIFVGLKK